ncbi:hypothetical protein KC963_01230, partial [Candidatus Saccharibacteria bacterium]|nr:hypothetical protein [Candidatus Saccharibacteria bacterium]
EAGLDRVMFTRCLYVPVLADIELRGIKIDHDRASTIRLNLLKEKAKLEDEFTALIGGASYSSPQQVAKVLYDDLKFKEVLDWKGKEVRTATNLRKTDKPTIAKLQAKTKKQKEFVRIFTRLNEVSDALSKVVKHFHDSAEANELIHFNFNQTIAQTHRLTSSGKKYKVQGQNINNTYKPCVRARYDGWYIGERDSSGCEFRVATELGKDLLGLEHVNAGRDFHSYTASVIFGSSFETSEGYARKQLRTRAKPHTFKPLYGGQSGTPDERKYYEAFRELYRGISETQDTWVDTVLKTKQLRMINGLVFYWPNAKVLKSGYIYESTKIKNYPVQSIATADATSVATIYLWHAMRIEKMQSFLTLVVHDNTVGELHPDEKDKWLEIGDRCFKDVIYWYFYNVYDYSWVVPLDSEYDIQYHWSDNPEWQEKYLKIQ